MDNPPLGKIKIAAPCNAEWKWMYGDDRVRFCGQCNLNVFNLSAMKKEDAEDLIRRSEGRLCVRFYRRRDGTILTENCPVGLQAIKDKFNRTRTHIIAAILAFLSYLGLLGAYKGLDHRFTNDGVFLSLLPHPTMGAIALPPEVSESELRERAIFKVIPIYHSHGSSSPRGDAVVTVIVDEKGIVESSWCADEDSAKNDLAIEAARGWKFKPFLINGEASSVRSTLTFHFGE